MDFSKPHNTAMTDFLADGIEMIPPRLRLGAQIDKPVSLHKKQCSSRIACPVRKQRIG
jgi:hypothetical protein